MSMTRTAKEIIRNAKWYGNLRNSNTSDFETCNSILNNEFYRLYNDIVRETDEYVSSFDFSGTETELPDDCMYVVGVYRKGDSPDSLRPVTSSPKGQYNSAEYKIENNTIRVINSYNGTYTVKYAQMPPTITAPDENEDITGKLPDSWDGLLSNDDTTFYVYDQSESKWYLYDTETQSYTETTAPSTTRSISYGEDTFTVNYDTRDFSNLPDYFQNEDSSLSILWADFDWPYAVITYSDYSVRIFTGEEGVDWNVFSTSGHATRGIAYTLRTNDTTGKGIAFWNKRDSHVYWCSFVPDTVLSYPQQIFFQLLEYRVASALAAVVGQNATYVNEVLIPQAEVLFYDTIKKDHFLPTRVLNVNHEYTYRRW